jgi:hypothetical protein
MSDFKIVDVPALLAVRVTTRDADGRAIHDDGEWHLNAASSQFVFAEFLVDRGLVTGLSEIRGPGLVIMWSQLSPMGQAFAKAHYDRWLSSVGRPGVAEPVMRKKLERRWQSYTQISSH